MRNDKQEKRNLLQKWLTTHLPDNYSTLFDHQSKQYVIAREAERLFKEKDRHLGMSLYVVCLNDPISNPIPVYIGKSSALLNRWKNGHIKKLKDAYHKKTSGSYAKWIDLFDREDKIPFIICVALGKALLELANEETTFIKLEDLADPFSKHLTEHLKMVDKQETFSSSQFLDACRQYNNSEISKDDLNSKTVALGFNNVIDAFHIVK